MGNHVATPEFANHGQSLRPSIGSSNEIDRHKLSDTEKLSYVTAVKCLYDAPSKAITAFKASRYDDFAALHINQTTAPDLTENPASKHGMLSGAQFVIFIDVGVVGPGIHFNGVFLPWHR